MVALVDVPGVQEAVEQILAAERAEAERQAERLRAELRDLLMRPGAVRGQAAGVRGNLCGLPSTSAGTRRWPRCVVTGRRESAALR